MPPPLLLVVDVAGALFGDGTARLATARAVVKAVVARLATEAGTRSLAEGCKEEAKARWCVDLLPA